MIKISKAITFKEYHEKAQRSVIYPKEIGLQYCAIKLDGEIGEVNELIGKAFRDDKGHFTRKRKRAISKEQGDCLWYIAGVCENLGFNIEQIATIHEPTTVILCETFRAFQKASSGGVCCPTGKDILDIGLKAAYHAGRVARFVYYKDDCGPNGKEFNKMLFELCSILMCLSAMCDRLKLSLDLIAKQNIRKLATRQRKGLLGGSGSDREITK